MSTSETQTITKLWFRDEANPAEISAKLLQHADTVEFLRCRCDALFAREEILRLELPKLRDLALGSFAPFTDQKSLDWLLSLESLGRLQVARSQLTGDLLRALRQAAWFPRLTYLELNIAGIEDFPAWEQLWQSKPLALRLLCLHFVNTEEAIAVIRGELPALEYLVLGSSIKDDFANALAQAELPALADLELRHASVSEVAFRTFVRSPRRGLPKLARIGWSYPSNRREDYCDWNGAVVDWGYEPMTPSELAAEFFQGSQLTLLPGNDTVDRKFLYEHARYVFGTFISRS